jgi:hypothetical protein
MRHLGGHHMSIARGNVVGKKGEIAGNPAEVAARIG